MNKLYLDKLLEFTHSTYSNYYVQRGNKNFDLNDEITKIKQNTSLNEKGVFIKYSFVDLSSLISSIEHDELVLIYPICFNIEENQEWFNLLNSLLLILNEDYIKESNIAKKKMLHMADKMYKKHLTIGKNLNEENYKKISELTNLNLIILNNDNDDNDNCLSVTQYSKENISKWVVCYKFSNYYFPVWNFEKKFFDFDSNFIKYLRSISKENKTMSDTAVKTETYTNPNVKVESKTDTDSFTDTASYSEEFNDKTQNTINKLKINDGYEEFVTNENYALYISEALDTKNTQKNKVKKNEPNINVLGEKKKPKTKKNIFVTLEQKEVEKNNEPVSIKIKDEQKETSLDNTKIKKNEEHSIKMIKENDNFDSSVFKKTEVIDKNKVIKIISNIKTTTKLEQIQAFALELGLSIVSGSTKDGKPKNKTKNEIIEEIKKLESVV
jgi:hypothetical protein